MTFRGGIRRPAAALALASLLGSAGCLPRLNRSAEPVGAPPYVTSVKIDPSTLEPIDEGEGGAAPDAPPAGDDGS
jgi:hypothetical protein